jgi:hypothetical protein
MVGANFRALVRQLESAAVAGSTTSSIDSAAAHLWWGLTHSQESKPKSGYYSSILPRLINIKTKEPPHVIQCTGRIVMQLSDPEFTPLVGTCSFKAPNVQAQCTVVFSVIDLVQVPHLPGFYGRTDTPLHMVDRSSVQMPISAYLSWVVSEFHRTFLDDQPAPPPPPPQPDPTPPPPPPPPPKPVVKPILKPTPKSTNKIQTPPDDVWTDF